MFTCYQELNCGLIKDVLLESSRIAGELSNFDLVINEDEKVLVLHKIRILNKIDSFMSLLIFKRFHSLFLAIIKQSTAPSILIELYSLLYEFIVLFDNTNYHDEIEIYNLLVEHVLLLIHKLNKDLDEEELSNYKNRFNYEFIKNSKVSRKLLCQLTHFYTEYYTKETKVCEYIKTFVINYFYSLDCSNEFSLDIRDFYSEMFNKCNIQIIRDSNGLFIKATELIFTNYCRSDQFEDIINEITDDMDILSNSKAVFLAINLN